MSNATKKFLTYNQQMKYLRDNKLIACSGKNDKSILARKGYFNLINGYKEPFTCGKDTSGNFMYFNGTSIAHFSALKEFDDALRILLLKQLTKVEEEVRTLAAYKFDEINLKSGKLWYEVSAYKQLHNINSTLAFISKAHTEVTRSKQVYVKHFMDNHNLMPTWILTKFLTLSSFLNFVECGKDDFKSALCELYSIVNLRGYLDFNLLLSSLHWMRLVRNMCAHHERVFDCVRKNSRIVEGYINALPQSYCREKDQRIFDLLVYFKYYLPHEEYEGFINEVKRLLAQLNGKLHMNAYNKVRASLGIKDVSHLDMLLQNPKNIEYHNF